MGSIRSKHGGPGSCALSATKALFGALLSAMAISSVFFGLVGVYEKPCSNNAGSVQKGSVSGKYGQSCRGVSGGRLALDVPHDPSTA